MATTKRLIKTRPERVFAVLGDGWTYSDWVVGTAHIRAVDADWPRPGTELHHKAGPWPVSIRDRTTVLECEPDRMLLLKLRLWPLGAGKVRFLLEPAGEGATRVTMIEQFTEGPLLALRNKVNDVFMYYRNRESLRRLGDLAVGRDIHPAAAQADPSVTAPDPVGAGSDPVGPAPDSAPDSALGRTEPVETQPGG